MVHSRQGFMVHGPWDLWSINNPRPEGEGCLWTINPCLLWFICYILHSDWSLLLLVNTHGSFHCEQGMLLVNM